MRLVEHTDSGRLARKTKEREYRTVPVGHCLALYHAKAGAIYLDRVFGPGRNWQADLKEKA